MDTLLDPKALVTRPVPCKRCTGKGGLPVVACGLCEHASRLRGTSPVWHWPDTLAGGTFPGCGHSVYWDNPLLVVQSLAACPACKGTGRTPVTRTAAQWDRKDKRAAREWKISRSQVSLVLRDAGIPGSMKRLTQKTARFLLPRCEAKTRAGGVCQNKVVPGRVRCRLHGGLSTGPKTEEGRARIRAARQARGKA